MTIEKNKRSSNYKKIIPLSLNRQLYMISIKCAKGKMWNKNIVLKRCFYYYGYQPYDKQRQEE